MSDEDLRGEAQSLAMHVIAQEDASGDTAAVNVAHEFLRAAVLAEREACARVCDREHERMRILRSEAARIRGDCASDMAARIRSRTTEGQSDEQG